MKGQKDKFKYALARLFLAQANSGHRKSNVPEWKTVGEIMTSKEYPVSFMGCWKGDKNEKDQT